MWNHQFKMYKQFKTSSKDFDLDNVLIRGVFANCTTAHLTISCRQI